MKKVITILMLLCFCLNIMPNASFAAESLDEALGEVSIYNGGSELKYLSVNGAVRPMTYVYFNYVNRLGQTKEIPAYCVNPNDKGVAQVVQQGQSVKYLAADKASDPKVMGIIACGYPTRSLKELGLENAEEAYYATKTALWCYLLSSWDINKTAVNLNLSGTEKAAAERVLAAARDIYTRGTWWDRIYTPKLTVQADQEYAYPVTINGTEYLQQEVTVTSETWVEYYINVAFADETAVPAGTKIVDMSNKETNKITFQRTGQGYSGKFKILYPKESVNDSLNSSSNYEKAVQLNFKGNVDQYAVYYAVCAETDKYGKIQNYICDTDPTAPINISFMSKYKTENVTDTPTEEEKETALEIIKVEKGTNKPLSGAIFEVKGPQGDVLGSFSTNNEGKNTLPLTLSGTYIVTEKTAPQDYLLSENNTQTVTVSYNQTATVTFSNEPYGDLRIEKIDGVSGESLAGAKIEVKSLADGTTYSGTTQTGGSWNLSELKPGVYEIKEIVAPKGYKLDDKIYTAKVNTGEVTTVTLKNYAKPGLRIIKYDEKTMERLPDTTFEVYRDAQLIGTFTTDELGEITLLDLAEGTYLIKEISTDDSHLVNASTQEIEIKTGEERIYELVFFNAQKPGISLVKVDKDTMQPLANAKFKVSLVGGSFTKEYMTDQNGVIHLENLKDGWYQATETKAPKDYILDTAPHNFEVKDGKTASITVKNSKASAILLHKIDSETKEGIYGVKFLLSDVNHKPIGTYESDQNGYVYIDEELEDGKYYIREIEPAEGYNLDTKERTFYLRYGKTEEIIWENTAEKGQIQIVKKSADLNYTNGLPAGTPLPNAVFTVTNSKGKVVNTIQTNENGIAVSKLLPLGYYTIEEIQAPAHYAKNAETITAHLEFSGQAVKFELLNKSLYTNVAVEKKGYLEAMVGQSIRYDFPTVKNNSNVSLNNFYWRDTLPTDAVRLEKISTGTWSENLNYKIMYKTNLRDYRLLKDNLQGGKNYLLDCSSKALNLASGEYVTEVMFSFDAVPPNFTNVTNPHLTCTVKKTLPHGYTFTNKTDVGGIYEGSWIMANDWQTTKVYNKLNPPTLPKTGY